MNPYCVYFVRQSADGPIKIGLTNNLKGRLETLQAANPYRLAVLATIPGTARTMEATLHRRFASGRLHGEWFAPDTPGLLELVADILRDDIPEYVQAIVDLEHRAFERRELEPDTACRHPYADRASGYWNGRPIYKCRTCRNRFCYPVEEEVVAA